MFIQDLDNTRQKREDMQAEVSKYQGEESSARIQIGPKRLKRLLSLFAEKQQTEKRAVRNVSKN